MDNQTTPSGKSSPPHSISPFSPICTCCFTAAARQPGRRAGKLPSRQLRTSRGTTGDLWVVWLVPAVSDAPVTFLTEVTAGSVLSHSRLVAAGRGGAKKKEKSGEFLARFGQWVQGRRRLPGWRRNPADGSLKEFPTANNFESPAI